MMDKDPLILKKIQYALSKARISWSDGTFGQKLRVFLSTTLIIPFLVSFRHLRLSRTDRRLSVEQGFCDHRSKRDDHNKTHHVHIGRIIAAYRASKRAQMEAPEEFQVRGLWAEWIDTNYKPLQAALETENRVKVAALMDNYNREPFSRSTGAASYDEYLRYRTTLTGSLYVRSVWCEYRDRLFSLNVDPAIIGAPLIGNPAGLFMNGDVIRINTFRHIYHALEMCGWLRDIPGAVIAEIGGGDGSQAYQTLRMGGESIAKYVLFDIPEVASWCSYFLLSAFPEKRIRLFGEGPVSVDQEEKYDLAVFPHFAVANLPADSIDLFHNACSFSEMDRASATAYLRVIEKSCRRYFSHINHDVPFAFHQPDGSISTNVIGSGLIPDPASFKRIFKKPRVFFLPEDRPFHAYEYLYEKIATPLLSTSIGQQEK